MKEKMDFPQSLYKKEHRVKIDSKPSFSLSYMLNMNGKRRKKYSTLFKSKHFCIMNVHRNAIDSSSSMKHKRKRNRFKEEK